MSKMIDILKRWRWIIVVVIIIGIAGLAGTVWWQTRQATAGVWAKLDSYVGKLKDQGVTTVIVSAGDGVQPAIAATGHGHDLQAAYAQAKDEVIAKLGKKHLTPRLARLDIVTKTWATSDSELAARLSDTDNNDRNVVTSGLSLDSNLQRAWLPFQLLASDLLDTDNAYRFALTPAIRSQLGLGASETLYGFETKGVFCDDQECVVLDTTPGRGYGLRPIAASTQSLELAMRQIADNFARNQLPSGRFLYGGYPQAGVWSTGYDHWQHAIVTWWLGNYSQHYPDNTPAREAWIQGLHYLLGQAAITPDDQAYIVNTDGKGISLGNTAFTLELIAQVLQDSSVDEESRSIYLDWAESLASGIQAQLTDSGRINNSLYYDQADHTDYEVDLSGGTNASTDAMATYALVHLYEVLDDEHYWQLAEQIGASVVADAQAGSTNLWQILALNKMMMATSSPEYAQAALSIIENGLATIAGSPLQSNYYDWLTLAQDSLTLMTENNLAEVKPEMATSLSDLLSEQTAMTLTDMMYPEIAMFFTDAYRLQGMWFNRYNHLEVWMSNQAFIGDGWLRIVTDE